MGFIDLSGSLGRHFGSIGVALNNINTKLTLAIASELQITGCAPKRSEDTLQFFCDTLKVSTNVHLHFENIIPEHVGLGSGTQLALAIGSALNALYNLGLSVREIAKISARGARSGIGIGVFEHGGLVVDGGRGVNTVTPPVISHLSIPADWYFILVFDRRGQGLHGQQELKAFQDLPSFPASQAMQLCYSLLMQALPAVAENELPAFGAVITQLQQAVGEHFAAVQGGIFTSPEVAQVMAQLQQQGAVAIGQTSWGPTGFCVVQGKAVAEKLVTQQQHSNHIEYQITQANNNPATITVVK